MIIEKFESAKFVNVCATKLWVTVKQSEQEYQKERKLRAEHANWTWLKLADRLRKIYSISEYVISWLWSKKSDLAFTFFIVSNFWPLHVLKRKYRRKKLSAAPIFFILSWRTFLIRNWTFFNLFLGQSTRIFELVNQSRLTMHPVGSSSKRKSNDDRRSPFVKILEQPARVYRFRYVSEGRGGSIPGLNSTDEIKTFPTIQVMNYVGPATVVVSCVTKNAPHKWASVNFQPNQFQNKCFDRCSPHPNKLLGTGCVDGVCTLEFNQDMKMVFDNLGIQRVLRPLERMDMNTIRLCFQVILEVPTEGTFYLKPAISEPIASKNTDLMITKLSHCSALCTGGQEIILLCENVRWSWDSSMLLLLISNLLVDHQRQHHHSILRNWRPHNERSRMGCIRHISALRRSS